MMFECFDGSDYQGLEWSKPSSGSRV
jgi:hypothetical protein